MILEISNLKEIEEENSKNEISNDQLRKKKNLEYFLKIKRNIIDLFLVHNDLLSEGQLLPKSNSEPNLNKAKNYAKNKIMKKEIGDKSKILNIEENKLNEEVKNKIFYFNINESNEKNQQSIKSYNSIEKWGKNINKDGEINLNENNSYKDMNIVNYKINNSESNINKIQNLENSKKKINKIISKNNPINSIEDNSSINSSKNGNSIKNSNNNNKRKSFYSASSFGKNFILKNKVCKSTKNNENKYNRNNKYSDDNPIMAYYLDKNLGNFYLVTDQKSQEELEGINYMNFFPMNEKETKNKDKDIMSCIYIDNKIQKFQKERNNDKINENNKNNEEDNPIFNFNGLNKNNGFELDENAEKKFDFQNIDNLNLKNNNNIIEDNFKKDINNENDNNSNNNRNPIKGIKINEKDNIDSIINNNNPIGNNYYLNINTNLFLDNNAKSNSNSNNYLDNYNNIPIKSNNESYNENNNEFPVNKEKKSINFLINGIDNNIINNYNNLSINEDTNMKLPLFLSNTNFDFNNISLKEFKLDSEILNELSNLNKIDFNQNCSESSDYQSLDNFYNPLNKQINNLNNNNMNNNIEFNFNNINNLNKNANIIYNKRYNINYTSDSRKSINIIPLNKSFYEYTDEELIQYAIPLIKDQSGCRFLQDKIKNNQYFGNEQLFPKIKSNIKELGCDPFGNYFLQVLIEVLNYDNLNALLNLVKKEFTNLCICPHGTRVIQKMIEKVATIPELINKFIHNINMNDLGKICKSAYGNHIIQKFLTTIHNLESTKFIYDYIYNNFLEIAETKHGVCVIQKCVSEGNEIQRKKLYDLILKNFDKLIKDQFANYLIQYILINIKSKNQFFEIIPLIKKIEDNLLDYCKSKFSANVIEKCFESNENYIKEYILESLLNRYKDNIIEILLDPYGIYIIQKALKLNSIYKKKLCDLINQKENELRNININDFKYKGIIKIINSIKELAMIFSKIKEYNNTTAYKYNNQIIYNNIHYCDEVEHRNNNRGKNKRGRKNYRGNNGKY